MRSALPTLYIPHLFCVPHPFHILHPLLLATPRYLNNPLPIKVRHLVSRPTYVHTSRTLWLHSNLHSHSTFFVGILYPNHSPVYTNYPLSQSLVLYHLQIKRVYFKLSTIYWQQYYLFPKQPSIHLSHHTIHTHINIYGNSYRDRRSLFQKNLNFFSII